MKKHTKNEDKDMRTLDIITHEVGLLEMQDGRTTADDRRWADGVAADDPQAVPARVVDAGAVRFADSIGRSV